MSKPMLTPSPRRLRRPPGARWERLGVLFWALVVSQATLALSEDTASAVPESYAAESLPLAGDQIWLVETRQLGCTEELPPALRVKRFDNVDRWEEATIDDLLASDDPQTLTIFYIHGARIVAPEAIRRGGEIYRDLVETGRPGPLRLIIWSWPASPAGRPIRDLRRMGVRTDSESYYLAWLLSQMDPGLRVSFLGFSYGGRVIGGALHLLEGGDLGGRTVDDPHAGSRTKPHAVLWSPATHNYWFAPGSYHGKALAAVSRMLIVYNPCDPALKYYRHAVCGRAQALGKTGATWNVAIDSLEHVQQFDAAGVLGKEHAFYNHLHSPGVLEPSCDYLIW